MTIGEDVPLLKKGSLDSLLPPHEHESIDGLVASHGGPDSGARRRVYSRVLRDVCVFSLAFFLAFTAWHPLQNLESTLFTGGSGALSGTVALGITYGSNVVCASTVAPVCVRRLGVKACMLFQFSAFCVIVCANACVSCLQSLCVIVRFSAAVLFI